MATPTRDEVLPRAFGRYLLFDHIGRGGMADIYLASARDGLGGERLVVVKEILPHLSDDEGFARMLVAEAKLAAQLNHANVVQVMDLGREDDRLYIAMEYVEGFDLNQLLRQLSKAKLPLPAEFAIFIIRETLRALDYAHRARDHEGRRLELVHRDVSPSNVLISFEGEIKLCDFGIARAFGKEEGDESRVQRARLAGKSAYMSPEQARSEQIDARSDVFAAGILLWELCAGRRLYKGSEEEMLALAEKGDVPPLPDRGLPEADRLQVIFDRAFATDRLKRYQTAADFLAELEEYAIANGLMASPLRFGQFLTEHFGEAIVERRRERERAAKATHAERVDNGEAPEASAEADATAEASRSARTSRSAENDPTERVSISRAPQHAADTVRTGALGPDGMPYDEEADTVERSVPVPMPHSEATRAHPVAERDGRPLWPWIVVALIVASAFLAGYLIAS